MKGDLIQLALEGNFDTIVHGCNCFCRMGRGIAKSIKEVFPEAYLADQATSVGDKAKLGTISSTSVIRPNRPKMGLLTVVNAYTQFTYWGGRGTCLADYDAIRNCFKLIKKDFGKTRIGYPKIGAGLAGGDWGRIKAIIDEELDGCNHTLVELD